MELRSEQRFSITNLSRHEYEMIIEGLKSEAATRSGSDWINSASKEYQDMVDRLQGML